MWGTILGGLGTIAGLVNQNNAQRDANRARQGMVNASNEAAGKEQAAAAELMRLYRDRVAEVERARAAGVWDADAALGRAERDHYRLQGRKMQNMGGGYAVMGYRPGDSEPGTRMQAAHQAGEIQRMQIAEAIRQAAPLQYLSALSAAEDGLLSRAASLEGAAANRLGGLNANLYNDASRRAGGLPNFVGALMPYFNQQPQQQKMGFQNVAADGVGTPGGGSLGSLGSYSIQPATSVYAANPKRRRPHLAQTVLGL